MSTVWILSSSEIIERESYVCIEKVSYDRDSCIRLLKILEIHNPKATYELEEYDVEE